MAPKEVAKKEVKTTKIPLEKPIGKKKIKKKNYQSFAIYLYKVMRSVTEENFGITRKSMLIMNDFVNGMLESIAIEASRLVANVKKNTLSSREIQTAIKLILPGELSKHANIEGIKALNLYLTSKKS